jgi:hypothetical protein
MQRSRAIVIFLAFIFFLFFVGWLLISSLGGHNKQPATPAAVVKSLPDYAATTAVTSMTIDGQVNGDDIHRAIRVTIGQNQRELDIIQGYSGHVLSSQTFYNTQDAYTVFLKSINNSGFLLPLKNSNAPADERGQCPLGSRYIFELDQNGSALSRLWASDCGSKIGTLGGSSTLLQNLFEAQIPEYQTLTEDVSLGSE